VGPTRQPLKREEEGWEALRAGVAQAGQPSEKRDGGRRGGGWAYVAEIKEREGGFLFFKQNFKALLNLNFEPKLFCSNSHFTKYNVAACMHQHIF